MQTLDLLVQPFEASVTALASTQCLLSVERRNGDGVESFLEHLTLATTLNYDRILVTSYYNGSMDLVESSPIEIYRIYRRQVCP